MSTPYALVAGLLFGLALYLLLRRSIVDNIFGLLLLGHAANLIVFAGGRLTRGVAPLLGAHAPEAIADPLPQALVLTAIVISFAIVAFAIVLVARVHAVVDSDDIEAVEEGPR